MSQRELFHRVFDAVPVPEGLDERVSDNARGQARSPRRALRTAVFAAVIVALLSACAVAVQKITSKPDLVAQCNLELDKLRELGVFTAEFEVSEEDSVPDYEAEDYHISRAELPEDRYEGVICLRRTNSGDLNYSYHMYVDTDTGKITELFIYAPPRDNWVPISACFSGDPGSWVLGIYDNFEALFDPEMTLGQLCGGWAQYQGYERYELPMDATDGVTFIGARELEAWNDGYSEPRGIIAAFYRDGEKEPEYYAFQNFPTGMGPTFIIEPAEGPYVPEDWTPSPREELPAQPGERDAAELINAELDKLRELGLLRAELEVTHDECERNGVTNGRIGAECTGKVYLTSSIRRGDCNYYLCYDAGTGKLDCLAVCPKPADGSLSVDDVYSGYGAVVDEGITVGEYCRLWAEYQGYERWELPGGVEEDTRFFDAHTLPAWDGGIALGGDLEALDGLTVSFYRAGGGEAECAYVKYGSSGIGPCVVLGSGYVTVR